VKTLTLCFDDEVYDELQQEANEKSRTISSLVREIVDNRGSQEQAVRPATECACACVPSDDCASDDTPPAPRARKVRSDKGRKRGPYGPRKGTSPHVEDL
jgi:hypothetical protein